MKFSYNPAGGSSAEVMASIRLAEALGFDAYWAPDSPALYRDTYVHLGAIAATTGQIAFGPGVTHPLVRHPVVTASSIATLAELAPGRVRLGIGVGDSGPANLGMRRSTFKELSDCITCVKALLAGGEGEWQGRKFTLRYHPDQPVPVYVAGASLRGPEIAGRLAEGIIWGGAPGDFAAAIQTAKTAAREAGRSPDALRALMWTTVCIHPDREVARNAVRPIVARKAIFSLNVLAKRGELAAEDVEPLARLTQAYDSAHHMESVHSHLVEERWIDRFAIAGGPADVQKRCSEIARDGADEIGIIFRNPDPKVTGPDLEQMRLFAEAVIQPLKST